MADREPVVCRFYRLFAQAPKPRRADDAADGMIGVRAYRYCEALRTASSYGWYLFPPINFALRLERNVTYWTYEGADGWQTLRGAQYPGFSEDFDRAAPDAMKALPPLCLAAAREPGVVQIWSGYLARTAPGWSLLSRKPANIPVTEDYEHFEGLVETDSWFGPLFTNIRLTRTHSEVRFHKNYPLFQVQPVRRECYLNPSFAVLGPEDLDEAAWRRYAATMAPNKDPERRLGHNAVDSRKRRRREAIEG